MTDTQDLKDRLRAMYSHRGDGIPTQYFNSDGPEAADAINRLEVENAVLLREINACKDALAQADPDAVHAYNRGLEDAALSLLAIEIPEDGLGDKIEAWLKAIRIGAEAIRARKVDAKPDSG